VHHHRKRLHSVGDGLGAAVVGVAVGAEPPLVDVAVAVGVDAPDALVGAD